MFDRNSAAYRQLITDIAEAVLSRIEARQFEPELPLRQSSAAPMPVGPIRPVHGLTPREMTILGGLVGGGSNKSIAKELGISARTVEQHRAHIMDKLGITGMAALMRVAMEAGILPRGSPEP